jgi:predicted dehydrogenase
MKTIKWGIIGCGDVAEIKSGPAFQKTYYSELLGVMRRNGSKAEDFAKRHQVPIWTDKAEELLDNKDINAIYIATPPSTHLEFALKAINSGKNVYLEKPMALNSKEAEVISKTVQNTKSKLVVAHYRRKLPAFVKVKELLEEGSIGKVLFADIQILQPKKSNVIAQTEENWRLDPEVSGGGYFYDIAPHQIDLMYHYFGAFDKIEGFSSSENSSGLVEDTVTGIIHFKNGIQFRGLWNFNTSEQNKKDKCIIYGTKGRICFSFYGEKVELFSEQGDTVFSFKNPKHIQQPMIAAVVDYFLDKTDNPCSAEESLLIMQALEKLSGRLVPH